MINNEVKKTLWAATEKLRSNMDAAEYKHIVLGMIFLKYVSDAFTERRTELARRFADPKDEYFIEDEKTRAEIMAGALLSKLLIGVPSVGRRAFEKKVCIDR